MSSPLRPSSWSVTMTTPPRRRSVHGSSSPSLSPSVSHSPSPSISPSSSHSFVVDFERSSVRTPASKSRASSMTLPCSSPSARSGRGRGGGKGSDGDSDGDGDSHSDGPAMLLGTTANRRYVPPMALLGSIVAVLVLTAGAASLMTAWLYAHKMPLKSPGVLYVNEGNEEERGREYRDEALGPNGRLRFDEQVSHPTTLTISSVTSSLLGYSLEPLMALVAYRLSADWLTLQRRCLQQSPLHSRSPLNSQLPRHAEAIDLPTPFQYALLAQLTSKVSLGAMVNTLRHLLLSHGSQAKVPAMLRRALAWSLVLFLLNFSIANLDVLLHETTRTVAVADVDAVLSSKPYGFALNRTLCSSSSGDASAPCLFDATTRRFAATASTKAIGAEGFLTATNASQSRLVQTFFDRGLDSDTARSTVYLTNPKVHRAEYAAALQTTGVSCHCRVVTPQCRTTTSSFDCTPLGHPELKVDAVTVATGGGDGDGDGAALLGVNNAIHVGQLPSSTGRLPLAVQLVYPVEGVDNAHTGFQAISPLVGNTSHAYVLALCELEYLGLGLSYFNGTYTLESQASADAPLAAALSGPLLAGEVTSMAASALAKAAGRVPIDDFASALGHAIGYHALALVGGLFEPQMVAVRQWRRILAQQYNFYLVAIYIGLLYAYALAAIIVFFWAWSVSSDTVSYYNDAHDKVEVPAALLAQRRLVDPITHLVQDHLSGGHAHALSPCSGHVSYAACHHHHHHHLQSPSPSPSPSPSLHSASGHHREKSEAALRTARRKMLQVFDEPRDQERVVIAVHDGGRGFGVWPASAARGTSC